MIRIPKIAALALFISVLAWPAIGVPQQQTAQSQNAPGGQQPQPDSQNQSAPQNQPETPPPQTEPAPQQTPAQPPATTPQEQPAPKAQASPATNEPKTTTSKHSKTTAKKKRARTAASADQSGKVVVRNGGAKDNSAQIAPALSKEQQDKARANTTQLLASTDANLKSLSGRQLTPAQQGMVDQVRSYVRQAKSASDSGDFPRAHTLANKALLLSGELAKK